MAPVKSYGAATDNTGLISEYAPGCESYEGIIHLGLSGPGQVNARFNHMLVVFTVVFPVGLYAFVNYVLTFSFHYHHFYISWFFAFCGLIPPCVVFYYRRKAYAMKDFFQAKWMTFLFLNCVILWIAALIVSKFNYHTNMKRFYDIAYLNTATSVDPSASSQQYIDTGRFLFHPDSYIDTNRAMGVRIGTTYCAAPVVNAKTPVHKRQYDFWVIGTGCCSAIQPQDQFHCGEIDNNYAYAGMRLMDDGARAMYRMAVQEAEATYKISAKHPIFVHWMQDPSREMQQWYDDGVWTYWAGVGTSLIILGFVGAFAGLCFAAAVTRSYPCKGTGFVRSNAYNQFMDEETLEEDDKLSLLDAKQVTL